jgi:two-component sensor histidine kinase
MSLQPLRLLRFAAVIGPLLLLAIVAVILWQQERARATEEVERSLEVLRQHVGRLVESQELLLAYIDDVVGPLSWDEIAASATIHRRLGELSRHSELTRSIALIDGAGRLRATDAVFPVAPADLSDRAYFRNLQADDRRLEIGERITSRLRGEDLFTFARRRSGQGFDGVIAAGISAREFRSFFESLRTDKRTAIAVTRSDGVVLVRSPPSPPQTLAPGTAFRQSVSAAARGVYETTSPIDGRRRLVGFSRVGELPIVVSYAVAKAALIEQWAQRVAIAAAGATLLAALGHTLATLALRRAAKEQQFRDALGQQVEARTAELRSSEQRATLLAREVDHRAKNMLAVVQAIVQTSRAGSATELKAGITGRVSALARAHSLLAESRWHGADLKRLVDEELAPFRKDGGPRVGSDGPPLALAPAAAQSLSLHELAINAVKHGSLARADGRLAVDWRLGEAAGLELTWTETGDAAPAPRAGSGLGLKVILRAVRDQLHGTVRFAWTVTGLVCAITVPADQLALDRPAA